MAALVTCQGSFTNRNCATVALTSEPELREHRLSDVRNNWPPLLYSVLELVFVPRWWFLSFV